MKRDKNVIAILILAAGISKRMGGIDKLLLPINGVPMLKHIANMALEVGCPTYIVLNSHHKNRTYVLDSIDYISVMCDSQSMQQSLRTGLAAIPDHLDVMMMPADLPQLSSNDLSRILDKYYKHPNALIRAFNVKGIGGHPVIIPKSFRNVFMNAGGDGGGGLFNFMPVYLDSISCTADIDTIEDWDAYKIRYS